MQLGRIYISKVYKLSSSFVIGLSFEITNHFHVKSENVGTDEIVIMIEFLFWGIDIQIDKT